MTTIATCFLRRVQTDAHLAPATTYNLQIEVGNTNETSVEDLPVTLAGTRLEFDAILRVPVSGDPGPNGYAFHFALKEKSV